MAHAGIGDGETGGASLWNVTICPCSASASLLLSIIVRTELRDVGERVLCVLDLKKIILYCLPHKAAMVPKAGTPVWRSQAQSEVQGFPTQRV